MHIEPLPSTQLEKMMCGLTSLANSFTRTKWKMESGYVTSLERCKKGLGMFFDLCTGNGTLYVGIKPYQGNLKLELPGHNWWKRTSSRV